MTALRSASSAWRSVCMTLAVLALVLKVAVPAGFMIDSRSDQPFTLVLCTAQGAVTIDAAHGPHHGTPDKPAKTSHEAPCAFAGHGAAFVAVEPAAAEPVQFVSYAAAVMGAATQTAPGRGLIAPPPPARGPPQVA